MADDDDESLARQVHFSKPSREWQVGETLVIKRVPIDFDDETTPTAIDVCVCGDSKTFAKAGSPVPEREPLACTWERDRAWWWCCTLRVGEVRITPAWWTL